MSFTIDLVPRIALFLMVAVSALPAISSARMLLLGVSSFYTVGAFASAWFDGGQAGGTLSLLMGAACGCLAAAVLAGACRRLRGDYFALATLCFAELARLVLLISPPFPGPQGIPGIQRGTLLGFSLNTTLSIAVAALLFLCAAASVTALLLRSPWASALRATSDNEQAAKTFGLPVEAMRSTTLLYAGAWSGLAGALGARHLSLADASTFALPESILVVVVLLLAGTPSVFRCLLFGTAIATLSEVLRFVATGTTREIAFAALLFVAALSVRDDLRNQDTSEGLP
jgi:branched-chain amino acid transport system permease protein